VSESISLEESQVKKPILAKEVEIVPVEDKKFIEKLAIKLNKQTNSKIFSEKLSEKSQGVDKKEITHSETTDRDHSETSEDSASNEINKKPTKIETKFSN